MARLLLVGATGLVGQAALRQALASPRVERVVAPTRRALPPHPKLLNPVVDFDALPEDAGWWRVDAVACALGTTQRDAGSRAAFRRVDLDYPLAIARLAKAHGAGRFALVSAMGANARSPFFYPRTKGELEQALMACGFEALTFVRPGLLGGERTRRRTGEWWAARVLQAVEPALPRRYRVVPADGVAQALLEAALETRRGCHVIDSARIPRP